MAKKNYYLEVVELGTNELIELCEDEGGDVDEVRLLMRYLSRRRSVMIPRVESVDHAEFARKLRKSLKGEF